VIVRSADGVDVVLLQPFTKPLPMQFRDVGHFKSQPRLLVLDETLTERFGSMVLSSGSLSFKFDEFQRLHVRVNGDEQVITMPWHQGALLRPVTDQLENERLTKLIKLGALLQKPNYYDE